MTDTISPWRRRLFEGLPPLLIGAAIPGLLWGRSVLAVFLVLALVLLIARPERRRWGRDMLSAFRGAPAWMTALPLVVWIPSLFASLEPVRSFEVWLRMILFLCAAMYFWAVLRDDRQMF